MLRSHTVWKKRQDDGLLQWRFVEKRVVAEVGGRECFVVERTCPSPEVDPFEIGGEPNIRSRDKPEDVGSVRVTLFIDAERWMQVGSELHRQDGHVLALVLLPRHQPESDVRGRYFHNRRFEEGCRGIEEVVDCSPRPVLGRGVGERCVAEATVVLRKDRAAGVSSRHPSPRREARRPSPQRGEGKNLPSPRWGEGLG